MKPSIGDDYLTTEVLTAPPQKLQLMLIEAALRAAQRTRELRAASEFQPASQSLVRAQQIVNSLLAGLASSERTPLSRRIADVYSFIYRSLVEAGLLRGAEREAKLAGAIRLLEFERETWRQVCDKLGRGHTAEPANDDYRGMSFVA